MNGAKKYFGSLDSWLENDWEFPRWLFKSDSEIVIAKIEAEIDDYRDCISDMMDSGREEEARALYREMLELFDDLRAAQSESDLI